MSKASEELVRADVETSGIGMLASRDVADIPKGDGKDEHFQLSGESWVILGEHENVPDWAVGKPAAVISYELSNKIDKKTGRVLYQYTDLDEPVVVRERSQGLTISVPLSSVQEYFPHGGRTAAVNFP